MNRNANWEVMLVSRVEESREMEFVEDDSGPFFGKTLTIFNQMEEVGNMP